MRVLALIVCVVAATTSAAAARPRVHVPAFTVGRGVEASYLAAEAARAVAGALEASGLEVGPGAEITVTGRLEELGGERLRLTASARGHTVTVEGTIESLAPLAEELAHRLQPLVGDAPDGRDGRGRVPSLHAALTARPEAAPSSATPAASAAAPTASAAGPSGSASPATSASSGSSAKPTAGAAGSSAGAAGSSAGTAGAAGSSAGTAGAAGSSAGTPGTSGSSGSSGSPTASSPAQPAGASTPAASAPTGAASPTATTDEEPKPAPPRPPRRDDPYELIPSSPAAPAGAARPATPGYPPYGWMRGRVVAHAIADVPSAFAGTGASATQAFYYFLRSRLSLYVVPSGYGMQPTHVAADEAWRASSRATVMARLLAIDYRPVGQGQSVSCRLEVALVRDGRAVWRRVVDSGPVELRRSRYGWDDPVGRAVTASLESITSELAAELAPIR